MITVSSSRSARGAPSSTVVLVSGVFGDSTGVASDTEGVKVETSEEPSSTLFVPFLNTLSFYLLAPTSRLSI